MNWRPTDPASGVRPPVTPAADVELRVRLVLVGQLFGSTPQAVSGGLVFALVLAWIVSGHASMGWVLAWAGAKLLLGLVRLLHVRRFLATPDPAAQLDRWLAQYIVLIVVDTVVWGSVLPLFAAGAPPMVLALLMCSIIGVTAVGVFTTFSHWPTAVIYTGLCLAPMAAWFALQATPAALAVTTGCIIYGALLGFESWRSSGRFAETTRLRLQVDALAQDRAAALAAAELSSEAKSRFLAMVSHEIRTPLNGILGMVQVMRGERPDPAMDHSLEVVEGSARHLGRIISDLLDLSAMDFGRLELSPKPVSPRDLLREVVDLLTPTARSRGLTLELHCAPGLPQRVLGDAARIEQVALNLVGNALKFTVTGGVQVRVDAPASGELRISVTDTGPGIAPADLARIFDAFERVGDPGTQTPGTGLGLTIARRLARAMGGDVSCESVLGQGSTFHFTLRAPLALGQVAPPAPPPPQALPGPVLVVDDNEVNAMVAGAMLRQLGVDSDVAVDGQQALQAMSRRRYAAVLMDCHMPVLNGWDATRQWRAQEAGEHLPIIGVTASAAPEDRVACLESGMDEHLPKPFEKAALAELLRRMTVKTEDPA